MEQQLLASSLADQPAGGPLHEAISAQRARLQEFCAAQRRRLAELRSQLAEPARQGTDGDGDKELGEMRQSLLQAQAERDQHAAQAVRYQRDAAEQAESSFALRRQVESLTHELAKLQDNLKSTGAGIELPDGDRQELEDQRRRYEMALDDLKAERARSRELEDKLQRSPAGTQTNVAGASDWEAQKRRLLAALEADFDETDENDRAERLQLEEVMRRTDAVVAEKQREISELQRLLEEQSANVGAMAVGAAAVAELLDKDDVVQQERKNLEALQAEWRDKVRTAEVEISMQRAKLARQQAQLDERTQDLEASLRRASPPELAAGKRDKLGRGRWLRRLGLKGGDDE